ncbi:1-acyl-sn-glycerol-3-phosphate acyltransferase [Salinispirillum sp. LH 10-3-1]|uniref:1-acyl-sn-glycerol-3-phosphate acyltransferase n=1 Tax=Salinispirillum sp. LH 10-3-1 TaxID=2952525 RepID=A0AB38YF21_9GAMM
MTPFLSHWPRPLKAVVFRLAGIHQGNQLLAKAAARAKNGEHFIGSLLAGQRIEVTVSGREHLESVQHSGYLVAGNHPHGLLDALALATLAEQQNKHFDMLARHFLTIFEDLRPHLLPLKINRDRSAQNGRLQLDNAINSLHQGNVVVITPAAHLSLPAEHGAPAFDAPWRSGVVRIARAAAVPIVPVTVQMKIPTWTYRAHRIHPIVRSIVQVWSVLLRRREQIHLMVHPPVRPEDLAEWDDQQATERLQNTVSEPLRRSG